MFAAVSTLLDFTIELEDFTVRSGPSAIGGLDEVSIAGRVGGRTFTGDGVATDVVAAAGRAYVNMVNRAVRAGAVRSHGFEFRHDFWAV